MARKKKEKVEILNTYTTKIKYKCPNRGWVEEEVTVKRYQEKRLPEDVVDVSKILDEED